MIKYIGSKRVLIPAILDVVGSLPEVRSVVDFFSGTSRVGYALKRAGYAVQSNDLMAYAHVLARCYVQADKERCNEAAAEAIRHLMSLDGEPGYFTRTFCEESRFFQPRNGARVDAMRNEIDRMDLNDDVRAVVLVSLMEAADRVDSTTGVQMAYLKKWAPRASKDIELRVPDLVERPSHGPCHAFHLEARDAADELTADLAYIDPPYNQHSYLGNYHIWETLVRWDAPDFYGVACKRIDCRTRKSDFNSKRRALPAFREFIERVNARFLVVSFNNEGYIPRETMEELLRSKGDVYVIEKEHARYVGSRIGIYNPSGDKVGAISHTRNKEYLYVAVPEGYDWSPASVAHGSSQQGNLFV